MGITLHVVMPSAIKVVCMTVVHLVQPYNKYGTTI